MDFWERRSFLRFCTLFELNLYFKLWPVILKITYEQTTNLIAFKAIRGTRNNRTRQHPVTNFKFKKKYKGATPSQGRTKITIQSPQNNPAPEKCDKFETRRYLATSHQSFWLVRHTNLYKFATLFNFLSPKFSRKSSKSLIYICFYWTDFCLPAAIFRLHARLKIICNLTVDPLEKGVKN